MDYTYATAQTGLLPYQDSRNAVSDPTITGLPVSKSLALRSGMRWGGFDVSLFAQNVLDQHPILFDARDFASPSVQLYFNRSVQPRTIGLTATYRY
jgi:iron complex outermembrane receptor protein